MIPNPADESLQKYQTEFLQFWRQRFFTMVYNIGPAMSVVEVFLQLKWLQICVGRTVSQSMHWRFCKSFTSLQIETHSRQFAPIEKQCTQPLSSAFDRFQNDLLRMMKYGNPLVYILYYVQTILELSGKVIIMSTKKRS